MGIGNADRMMRYAAIRLDDEAGRTQEIAAVDILEETPIGGPGRGEVPSIWPLSVEAPAGPVEATFKLEAQPRRRLLAIVAGAMGLSLTILVAALSQTRESSPQPAQPTAVASPAPTPPPSSGSGAVLEIESEPVVAGSGTISSPGSAWPMFIDGKRITAASAIVSCGHHIVRVGRARAHDVVVQCGATIVMDAPASAR